MLSTLRLAALSTLVAGALVAPATENYDVDKTHSSIHFRVKHLGVGYVYGRFNDFSGKFVVDADPAKCSVELAIKTESVDTNDKNRDEHLKSPDFFNAKQFPTISFKSKKVAIQGDKFEVSGDVTIKGVTKPSTISLLRIGSGTDPMGSFRMGFEGDAVVKRSEFGVDFMPDGIGDEVMLRIAIEGIRK